MKTSHFQSNSVIIKKIVIILAGLATLVQAQGEGGNICEVKPNIGCYQPDVRVDSVFVVQDKIIAISKDGLNICNESEVLEGSRDIVLVMDNTGSMENEWVDEDGVAHYCDRNTEYGQPSYPNAQYPDPECISGDPEGRRAPAFHAFLDSALVKSGGLANIGVVLFSNRVTYSSNTLSPLTSETIDNIKATIVNNAEGTTNYTLAIAEAMNILEGSDKPKDQQVIIFLSDGRPNQPQPNPYIYKEGWDDWPTVHTIFLGDNVQNQQDLFDIASRTGGEFYQVVNVNTLAGLLTRDIINLIFVQGQPVATSVANLNTGMTMNVGAAGHLFSASDSGQYTLDLPGPIFLDTGMNEVEIVTTFTGGRTETSSFRVYRGEGQGEYTWLSEAPVCRNLPVIVLYNDDGRAISMYGESYAITDSTLTYEIITGAEVDTFSVRLITSGGDAENQQNDEDLNKVNDSTWMNNMNFVHDADAKTGDYKIQTGDNVVITLSYRNPYLPIDSASVSIRVKFGPGVRDAAYHDLDGDGRAETVIINFDERINEVPDQLRFVIVDSDGDQHIRTAEASAGEIVFGPGADKDQVIVTLTEPFPLGVTDMSFPEDYGQTFDDADVPVTAGTFPVDDSIPPVILEVKASNPDDPVQTLTVTFSEAVEIDENARNPLSIKRDSLDLVAAGIEITSIRRVAGTDNQYVFELGGNTQFYIVGGDSVAITPNGEVTDGKGLAPTSYVYKAVKGSGPEQSVSNLTITNPREQAREVDMSRIEANSSSFVLIDENGAPMPGNTEGKCGDCYIKDGSRYIGPVIKFVTEFPLVYEFKIFSNLGHYVTTVTGRITSTDLALLADVSDVNDRRPKYQVRIVWDGRISKTTFSGAGVYLIKAVFKYEANETLDMGDREYEVFTRLGLVR